MIKFIKLCLLTTIVLNIPTLQAQKKMKIVTTLNTPIMGGVDGMGLVWHPIQKKYYAAMAGNSQYYIAVPNINGKKINTPKIKDTVDFRGLWYDPNTKMLIAKMYEDNSWVSYSLNKIGVEIPQGKIYKKFDNSDKQPEKMSSGCYDKILNAVGFINSKDLSISYYTTTGTPLNYTIKLKLKNKIDEDSLRDVNEDYKPKNYNITNFALYQANSNEIGLVNIPNKAIEIYTRAGIYKKSLPLPDDIEPDRIYNFTYSNGMWWFYYRAESAWFDCK